MKLRLPGFPARHKTRAFLIFWAVVCPAIVLAASRGLYSPVVLPWSAADRAIPFIGEFVYVYYSHFLFIPLAFYALREAASLNRALWTMGVATVSALPLFFLYPLVVPKPYFTDSRFPAEMLFGILQASSAPLANCFPSLHAAYALLSALPFLNERRRLFPVMMIWAVLICASTVLAKQHYFIDLAAGVVLALALHAVFHVWVAFEVKENPSY